MQTNKFASGCASCSVLVFAGGGRLSRGELGWEVLCGVCRYVQELTESGDFEDGLVLPDEPPPGCAKSIRLRVLGLTRTCWKCERDTASVVGLYPDQPNRHYVGLHTTDSEPTIALARDLLHEQGCVALSEAIRPRYSKTAGRRYLSNGCWHCGALQGSFPLGEEVLGRVVNSGLSGLEVLVVADCPVMQWWGLVHENRAIIGV